MFNKSVSSAAAICIAGNLALMASGARAQTAASVLKYASAFEGYARFTEEKRAKWRELNATVGTLGGHAAHLRDGAPDTGNERPGTNRPAAPMVQMVPMVQITPLEPIAPAAPMAPAPGPASTLPAAKPAVAVDPHAGHGKGGAK